MTVERKEWLLSATLVLTLALVCLLLASALLFLSAAPYDLVLRMARTATGSQNPLSRAQSAIFLRRTLPAGMFYGLLALTLLLFRKRLISQMAHGFGSLRACLARNGHAFLQAWREESPWHLGSLALILAGGIVLRLLYVGEPPRNDESFAYVSFVRRSLVHVLTLYSAPNNHILHSALEWISCRVFGDSLWAMRLPALLAGVALIPFTYLTARRLAGETAGLIAAGLISTSGPFVLYSVNARGYTLQAVLLVIMLYLAAEIVDGAPGIYWGAFSAAAVAGFWTSPTMLYSYLIAALWLLWSGSRAMLRPMVIWGVITALAVVFLYMPVLVVSGPDTVLRNQWVQPLPLEEFRAEAARFPKDVYTFLHGADPLAAKILIASGVLLGLLFKLPTYHYRAQLFLVLLVVLLVVPLVQRIVPFPRVLVPIFAVYYLSAAFGLSVVARQEFARQELACLVVLLGALAVMCFHLTRSGYIESSQEFRDSQAVANFLASQLRPCDRLIISVAAGAQVAWQLHHAHVPYIDYSKDDTPGERRILVATQTMPAVLPPRGNGVIDPSVLTLDGTLREAGVNTAEYLSSQLIYKNGRGEVFQLTPRRSGGRCQP